MAGEKLEEDGVLEAVEKNDTGAIEEYTRRPLSIRDDSYNEKAEHLNKGMPKNVSFD